ncbi:glycosyltransferase family 2 protein [Kordiimonas laminariae]|uniref:glycosyltransferase family 2 protein n=1 Tax=Kordiimonas laminariae TaxID=2917717 RepID=UPI001FF1E14A|nr:glycosyltransferase family 2 protein [Kordiimonas laminariae]MCK0069518.1 glycosyltransferase family 2 protein [Kordiimonas laminariae]
MPLFSVVIPTYTNCETIVWAIRSVQEQSVQDFEILVVGDGAPQKTSDIMAKECAKDKRITFFENSKGEGNGEKHRHAALKAATGKYVAYLGDDDLWHKSHLETLVPYLQEFDFLNTVHLCVYPDQKLIAFQGDLSDVATRRAMMKNKYNFFGPTTVAHRMDSYNRLPTGWSPKPKGMWSDLHMWRQWFAQKDMRFKTVPEFTSIHLDSSARGTPTKERALESLKWLEKLRNDDAFQAVRAEAIESLLLDTNKRRYAAFYFRDQLSKMGAMAANGQEVSIQANNRIIKLRPAHD